MGFQKEMKQLMLIEFTSARKRMTLVVQEDDVNRTIKVYVKGADNVIFARLRKEHNPYKENVMDKLKQFSMEGLRTLCFAMKTLTQAEFNAINKKY